MSLKGWRRRKDEPPAWDRRRRRRLRVRWKSISTSASALALASALASTSLPAVACSWPLDPVLLPLPLLDAAPAVPAVPAVPALTPQRSCEARRSGRSCPCSAPHLLTHQLPHPLSHQQGGAPGGIGRGPGELHCYRTTSRRSCPFPRPHTRPRGTARPASALQCPSLTSTCLHVLQRCLSPSDRPGAAEADRGCDRRSQTDDPKKRQPGRRGVGGSHGRRRAGALRSATRLGSGISRGNASELDTVQSKLEYSSEVRAAVHCAGLRVNMNDVGGQWEGKSEHVASCGGNMYIRERRERVVGGERWSEGHTGQVEGALSLQKSYSVI